MEEKELFASIEGIFKEHKRKSKFLSEIKSMFFVKEPAYRIDFNILIIELQNHLENIFDRILRSYLRPK